MKKNLQYGYCTGCGADIRETTYINMYYCADCLNYMRATNPFKDEEGLWLFPKFPCIRYLNRPKIKGTLNIMNNKMIWKEV